jgi:hypothetical protein
MASVINLSIDKGTNFEATFNLTNFDSSAANLAGYTATARVKKTSYSDFVQIFFYSSYFSDWKNSNINGIHNHCRIRFWKKLL